MGKSWVRKRVIRVKREVEERCKVSGREGRGREEIGKV